MPGNETIRRLSPCLVFMAIGAVIGSLVTYLFTYDRPTRDTLFTEAEIIAGMTKEQVRRMLGQPDGVGAGVQQYTQTLPVHVEQGTPAKNGGTGRSAPINSEAGYASHRTRFRLEIFFIKDKVVDWQKEAPLDEQPRP